METMYQRIKELRKKENLTQDEFSNKIGVSRSNYSQFEIGKSNILPTTIAEICKQFNARSEWILLGVGEMYNSDTSEVKPKLTDTFKDQAIEEYKATIEKLNNQVTWLMKMLERGQEENIRLATTIQEMGKP